MDAIELIAKEVVSLYLGAGFYFDPGELRGYTCRFGVVFVCQPARSGRR